MRCLFLSALALVTACGSRPDPQRLAAAQKGALRGEAGVIARRLLSEAQFNDYGYPTADGRFLSTTDMSTGDLAVRDLSTGAKRRVGLKKNGWASDAYVETSMMSPDGRRIALSWSDDDGRYSIRVADADGGNARVVYNDSAYYYMEVNGFAPDGRHVVVELDRTNGTLDYGWLDLDGGGIRFLFKNVTWVLGDVLFSPDGRYAAYNGSEEHPNAGPRDARILEIATGRTWPLVTWPSDESPNGWAPDGRAIVLSSDRGGTPGFWLQPVRDGRADGEARLLRPDTWNVSGVGVTRDGRLLYTVRTGGVYLYQATIDTGAGVVVGEPVRMDDRDNNRQLSALGISRNGEWLVHNVPDRNKTQWGQSVLTFRSLVTGETRKVKTTLSRIFGRQHWSPDGTRIFTRGDDANHRTGVFVVDITTGQARTVLLGDTTASAWAVPWNLGWTPTGKEVIYRRYDPDSTIRTVAADGPPGDSTPPLRSLRELGARAAAGAHAGPALDDRLGRGRTTHLRGACEPRRRRAHPPGGYVRAGRPCVDRGWDDTHVAVRNDRQLHTNRRSPRRPPCLLRRRALGQRAVGARRLGLGCHVDAGAAGRTVIPSR
jgi:Tol biopolymer transport system component